MNNFFKSKTCECLYSAFLRECGDSAKLVWLANDCSSLKLTTLSSILREFATNELAHAKIFYNVLKEKCGDELGSLNFAISYPLKNGNFETLLADIEQTEAHQATSVFPNFAEIAVQEGFTDIAQIFMHIAQVEAYHSSVLNDINLRYSNKSLFKSPCEIKYTCSNCGHQEIIKNAWKVCPLCGKDQGFVKLNLSFDPNTCSCPPKECKCNNLEGFMCE